MFQPGLKKIEMELIDPESSEVKILKWHKDTPSVIEWNGRRYIFEPVNKAKPKKR